MYRCDLRVIQGSIIDNRRHNQPRFSHYTTPTENWILMRLTPIWTMLQLRQEIVKYYGEKFGL